jgi:DNA-binding NarL/FixJ family response regulator
VIRLLLVDDHASSREALALLLGREPDLAVVAEAGSLAEARRALAGAEVDVALVDLELPDGSGVDLIRDLRAANPEALALVVTGSGDRHEHARAVAAGAAGVLHKSARTREIVAALRRLCAGETLLSPREAVELLRLVDRRREEERAAQLTVGQLTPRERELLGLLAEGLGDEAIAARLFLSPKTVRNQMTAILGKLGVDSRLQALVLAARHGVVRVG